MNNNKKQQMDKYYKLAEMALKEYLIEYDDLSFLQHSENITFCVKGKDNQDKFLVRIHKSILEDDEYQCNRRMIHSEMLLLEELNKSGQFKVQVPVMNKAGSFITQVIDESINSELNVTLLKWVDGELIEINEKQYDGLSFQLGKEMAKAHNCLKYWKVPQDFVRMEYDLDTSKKNLQKLNKLVDSEIITKTRCFEICENTLRMIEFIEKNLPKEDNWGLIHGDLNEGNYVTDGKQISFIDFSRCGYGYYLYDIAQTLMHLNGENRKHFLKGYGSVFYLPAHYEKLLDCFFVLAIIDNMLFLASNPEEYDHVSKTANYLCEHVIKNYNNDKRVVL